MLLVQAGFFNIPSWPVFTNFLKAEIARPFSGDLLHWQWLLLFICLLVSTHQWLIPSAWFTRTANRFRNYAQNRSRAIWICMLFPAVVRVALLPAISIKPPSVHDEFSWLLMADTFRLGRLTNPIHPFWQHFESIHIIQRPTYASMYPPGFGAFLAVGALLHHPWLGVLLSVSLLCGCLCWMLQAWVPPVWAFGGALLAALQIGIGSYWMNSFVGGAPAPALAGALVLGSIPRFLRKPVPKYAVLFALGTVLLVNTRPFEGTILALLCAALTFFWYRTRVLGSSVIRWRALVPAVFVLVAGAAFTLYYSWRVTGNPLKPAYVVNHETYGWPENFAFLPPVKVAHRHPNLKNMQDLELARRARYSTFGRMLDSLSSRYHINWEFFVGPGLTLPLLMLPWTIRSRKLRPLLYIVVIMFGINTLQLMAYPQHVAGMTGIFYLLLVGGLRQLCRQAHLRNLMPERVMAGLALCVAIGAGLSLFMEPLHFMPSSFWEWTHWPYRDARAALATRLEQLPGQHVIFVRYGAAHNAHEEWVYNAARIDRSKVVWANAMNWKDDTALRNYYKNRQAWIFEPDTDPSSFLPFTSKTYGETATP
jgi:hypothetical protein